MTYPVKVSKAVHKNLSNFFEDARTLYNAALEYRINQYEKTGESVSYFDLCKDLTDIRQQIPEYSKYDTWIMRSVLQRLDRAYKQFFKLGGFPRFKGRSRGIRSFEIIQFKIHRKGQWNSVTIKGIGRLRFKGHIDGKVKVLRVVKTPVRIKIQLVCELPVVQVADPRDPIGIDMGIKSRIVLSDAAGEISHFEDKRVLDRSELKRRQRRLSKAVKGSHNRNKKRAMLAKEWHRVTEREKGYLHELTTDIVKNISAHIALEDLQIPNMVKNRKFSRSIIEQNWGTIKQMLTYKAESAGGEVKMVSPHYTSQTCSACGSTKDKGSRLSLSDRVFECHECGHEQDRDSNACRNILFRGFPDVGGRPTMQAEGRLAVGRKLGNEVSFAVTA